ncbi:hypoxia inducible factor 1 subunit alpha, like 2 isoform X2 [Ictalurus punctatus]|uniref:Hypoxia inducible factor 1 subunit alpha, like 2 isoform X2 n=1 Tax=Ictalurus punctatus TaxID=7998 RepID=A0A2D0T155_ICTPU|nr:hypoxia inducible factor 1 subunit alpha, like 2 isoform X2 [Ictalurus punctatus]
MCLECRKARSRVAAQSRREKESQLLRELAALLPLAPSEADQLDKASVIRVTISYLHLRALLDIPDSTTVGAMMHPISASQGELPESIEKWFLDTLEGFLLLLSLCGKIIFITKDAVSHIGIKQTDLIGRSLFDFIHPSDHKEIKEILTRIIGSEDQQKCEVFLRIKGAVKNMLTPWQVIHCTGNKKSSPIPGSSYLLLLCRSLPVQEVIEMEAHLNFKTFLSIHEPDMKFTYCHSGVLELTGFSDVELYGQSVYQYYHPSDCQHIFKAHLCYKPTNSSTEILHRAALCGSLSNDMYDLDLDSLAPYIPTHEEDFHLTPILDGVASDSVLNRHLPSLNETWLTLDAELPTDSETVFSHRVNMNKNPMLVSSSQWHDSTYTMNKKQQVRFKRQISIPEKKTNHWTDVSQHLAKTFSENFVWNCSQSYAEPLHLAYKYAKRSWCPPGSSTQHSNQNTEGKMPSVLVNLPVLSRWECEVNAPLGPTSHLLQGTELITVLDQVASGLCWY